MTTLSTGLATSFINFSRTSNATVTDRDGKIKWAGHNLLLASESFDSSSWTNGTVTIAANNALAPNGTQTAEKLTAAGADSYLRQSVSVTGGVNYTLSVYLRADTPTTISIYCLNPVVAQVCNVTTQWQQFSLTVSPASSGSVGWQIGGGSSFATGQVVYAWGAHLYRSDLGGMQQNPAMPSGMTSYYPTTPRNLLGQTEGFDTATWSKNSATAVSSATVAPNGLPTSKLFTSSGTSYPSVSQSVTVAGGSRNTLSLYVKADNHNIVSLEARYNANDDTQVDAYFDLTAVTATKIDTNVTATIDAVGDGWYRIRLTKLNPGPGTSCIFIISGSNVAAGTMVTGKSFYLWGAQLSDSASLDTYVPVYGGAVSSAAYYAPRLDFDPVTLAARGLLVEEQRSNSFQYSEDFTNGVWAQGNISVAANDTASPTGNTTAEKLTRGATNASESMVRYTTSQAVSTSYAVSCYVKTGSAGAKLYIRNLAVDNSTTTGVVQFDPANGTISLTYGSTYTGKATMTAVGDGWYRCVITGATGGTISNNLVDIGVTGGTSAVGGTSGDNLYIYGAQLEAGSFATSYIPTGSATATRTADVASVSTQAFPYSASEGTWVAAFQTLFSDGAPTNTYILVNDASQSRRIAYISSGTQNLYSFDGATTLQAVGDVTGAISKIASAYDASGRYVVTNGGTVASGTVAAGYSTSASVYLGNIAAVTGVLNGHIRQITYLPRRLTNAELQSRTA